MSWLLNYQNEIAVIVLAALCFAHGRRKALPIVIFTYYLMFFALANVPAKIYKVHNLNEVVATYMTQAFIDACILYLIFRISLKYQENIKILQGYALCVASSLAANLMMIFDQVASWNYPILAEMHHLRQLVSVPLDLLFAVLWSAKSGRHNDPSRLFFDDNLLSSRGESYNRLHRNQPPLPDPKGH